MRINLNIDDVLIDSSIHNVSNYEAQISGLWLPLHLLIAYLDESRDPTKVSERNGGPVFTDELWALLWAPPRRRLFFKALQKFLTAAEEIWKIGMGTLV